MDIGFSLVMAAAVVIVVAVLWAQGHNFGERMEAQDRAMSEILTQVKLNRNVIDVLRSNVLLNNNPDRLEQMMTWTQEMFADLIRMRLVTTAPQTAASWLTQERLMKQAGPPVRVADDEEEHFTEERLVHAG